MSIMNKWKSGKSNDTDDIPMAAMPDIAFLLLVFFMVSTTFLITRKMNVELPSYEGESSDDKILHVNVILGPDRIQVKYGDEEQQIQMVGLQRYVLGALKSAETQNEKVVLMEVDRNCPFQRVVDAFDAIRSAGGYVSIVESTSIEG